MDILLQNYQKTPIQQQINSSKKIFGSPNSRLSKILNSQTNTLHKPKPIILIPEEVIDGNLSLNNVEQFLTQGQYVEAQRDAANDGFMKEVYLRILDRDVSFEIWNNFFVLQKRKRLPFVVALFIKGTANQFQKVKEQWGHKNVAVLF